ncbi:CHM2A protein, partial [Rhipidura dahli]|nr:CHM2A protein [Rhipidura dahli]
DAVRVMAKDLVRTRRYVRKFIAMRANVQGVALRVQTLKSNSAMASAMRGVTRAMATMNRQVRVTWGEGHLGSPGSCLHHGHRIWGHSGAIWDISGNFGTFWGNLGPFGGIWGHFRGNLGHSGGIWDILGPLPPPGGSLAAGEGRGGAEAASAALADADADLEERLKNLRRD